MRMSFGRQENRDLLLMADKVWVSESKEGNELGMKPFDLRAIAGG